ncbi:MAG TPA: hypothetical protein VMG10_02675 [Gemmataceae bacterium]|nr:hypothetical protein [Gemmataceae bacterium]
MIERLSVGPKRWQALTAEVREELWLGKHLNEVIRSLKKSERIVVDGKFAQTHNPLLKLASQNQLL